ncbi:MAG: FAD-binding oxidoreductase [Myxococcota bacterium]
MTHAQAGGGPIARAIEEALGAGRVAACALDVLGARVEREVAPSDGAELATCLRALGAAGGRALVRGGGSRDGLGNRLGRVDVALSTRALAGVEEFDAQDGVVRVRAGTQLAVLAREVREQGWELPLDAPGPATVGGALAAAAFGPRRLGLGAPKHAVLGLDVVLGSGERTRCGGRVVKNVTGFDLAKLYVGSFGTLGVIEAAWLRLRPRPERVVAFAVDDAGGASAAAGLALECARRATARCAALVAAAPGEPRFALVAELAGPALAVEADLDWAASRGALRTLDPSEIDALGARADARLGDDGVRARIAMLPSAVGLALGELALAGAELVAHAGLGLVHAQWRFDAGPPGDVASRLAQVERVARTVRGHARLESLPLAAAAGRDVFGLAGRDPIALALARSLERRFDPHGVLDVGRAAGRP